MTKNSFDPLTVEEASDVDDGNYSDEIPSLKSDTDSDVEDITNEEVRVILSSNFEINRYISFQLANSLAIKTIAECGAAARQPRKKNSKGTKRQAPVQHVLSVSASKRARVEDADGEDDVQELTASVTSRVDHTKKVRACAVLNFIWTVHL